MLMMGRLLSTKILSRVNKWLVCVHDLFLPPRCVLCGQLGHEGKDLCRGCASELPYMGYACQRCAIPLSQSGVCGACQKSPPSYDAAVALFLYEEPVDYLICALKFEQKLYCARLLGTLMADRARDGALFPGELPDLILPVPLHSKRMRQRGFNQSLELIRPLATARKIAVKPDLVRRCVDTEPQSGMDAVARRRNLQGAFEVVGDVHGAHIAIVDHVMTTGSTVETLARTLKRAGASQVTVLVCARAVL